MLIARTDARGVADIDEAIERARATRRPGPMDLPRARNAQRIREICRAIDAPLVANMTEFGKSPLLSLDELADLGYAAVSTQ